MEAVGERTHRAASDGARTEGAEAGGGKEREALAAAAAWHFLEAGLLREAAALCARHCDNARLHRWRDLAACVPLLIAGTPAVSPFSLTGSSNQQPTNSNHWPRSHRLSVRILSLQGAEEEE